MFWPVRELSALLHRRPAAHGQSVPQYVGMQTSGAPLELLYSPDRAAAAYYHSQASHGVMSLLRRPRSELGHAERRERVLGAHPGRGGAGQASTLIAETLNSFLSLVFCTCHCCGLLLVFLCVCAMASSTKKKCLRL